MSVLVVLFFVSAVLAAAPGGGPPLSDEAWLGSSVHHLTASGEKAFDTFVKANPSTLVMFYAPWCGHCKNMKPAYVEAAKTLTGGALAAVDCTQHGEVCQRHGTKGYPTIKYVKDGVEHGKYERGRTAADFLAFMADPTAPAPAAPPPPPPEAFSTEPHHVALLNDANFTTYMGATPRALVMFFAPWCGHCKRVKPDWVSAAAELEGKDLGGIAAVDCTQAKPTCSKFGVKGFPTIKYFRDGAVESDYSGSRSKQSFIDYITARKDGPVAGTDAPASIPATPSAPSGVGQAPPAPHNPLPDRHPPKEKKDEL